MKIKIYFPFRPFSITISGTKAKLSCLKVKNYYLDSSKPILSSSIQGNISALENLFKKDRATL